jgi:hypothetical protein
MGRRREQFGGQDNRHEDQHPQQWGVPDFLDQRVHDLIPAAFRLPETIRPGGAISIDVAQRKRLRGVWRRGAKVIVLTACLFYR